MWGVSNQIGNMSSSIPFVQFQMVIQKVPFPTIDKKKPTINIPTLLCCDVELWLEGWDEFGNTFLQLCQTKLYESHDFADDSLDFAIPFFQIWRLHGLLVLYMPQLNLEWYNREERSMWPHISG